MIKKLSYGRDSARLLSLRRSRSFEVTNLVAIESPHATCLPPFTSYRTVLIKLLLLTGVPLFNEFVLHNLDECVAINHILPKTRFSDYILVADNVGHSFNQFDAVSFKI